MGVTVNRSSSDLGGAAAVRRRFATPRPDARAASAVHLQLERLTRTNTAGHPVVSCYLKLEPRDRSRGKYLIKIKNRVKRAKAALPQLVRDRSAQEAVARDLDRIVEHLRSPANLPGAQGLAIFASEGIGLFEVTPMPLIHRSRLAVDGTPLVRELAAMEDEFGRVLTVVLDRTSARFFEVTAYHATELPSLRADSTRGGRFRGDKDGPGWGEHNYHNRIREEKQRHFESIARELFARDRRQPAHGIVLAGPGPEAGGVRPFLHSYLTERLLGTAKLNPKEATTAAVHTATLAVRESWERASERALVSELRERQGSGWAVNGLALTLRALSRGQVRALLVSGDASAPGFRCPDTGRLALTEKDCRPQGGAVRVLDVVDDAIEEALRQGVDVNVVYEPAAAREIEVLAGLLRFR
jgi:peptide chain release factor subunit 1